jgi:hypothetical protein
MHTRLFRLIPAACLALGMAIPAAIPALAADKPKAAPAPPPAADPYTQVQPATETLDLATYQRIRDEGFNHSHVMEFASALMDGIGPRLTGSPNLKKANEWTRDTLTKIGLENAHLEDWGEFGLGWQQLNTWARMTTPDTAILILQATPWSPSTPGPVTGDVVFVNISSDKDFDQSKGKLEGKIVLFGAMREVPPVDKALFSRYTDQELADLADFPVTGGGGMSPDMQRRLQAYVERNRLIDKIATFFADEKVAAVIEPSRDGKNGGGSGGTLFDDNGATLGRTPYIAEKRVKVPVAVAAIESYGRLYRLTQAHAPVSVEIDIETKFTGDHEHGFNTVAEIPGTDPSLKEAGGPNPGVLYQPTMWVPPVPRTWGPGREAPFSPPTDSKSEYPQVGRHRAQPDLTDHSFPITDPRLLTPAYGASRASRNTNPDHPTVQAPAMSQW